MDLERYYELRAILQQWRLRLAESIRGRIEDSARWLNRLQAMYEGEGVSEAFDEWLDRWCRQAAIQFILRILFLRVLEDRGLLGVVRIRNTDGQKMWAQLTRNLGAAHYVQWCCWDAAHLLPDLFGPTDYDLVLPDDELAQRFLDDVWRRPDPNRPGWLRFDFRPDPARDDEGFDTRFIGDLYQELDPEIRERYALLQTPHFISQFILEHTLLTRFEEKDFREVTLIDPTCGSGHFLVDAFWMFVKQYEEAASGQQGAVNRQPQGKSRLTSNQRAQIARTIVEKHVFGCDINPHATALARFRLTLAACDYARLTSLRDLRDLRFNLVTIDSLIPYENLMVSGLQADSATARALGQPQVIQRALPVLRKRYDVVVGNPPYVAPYDPMKRDFYREHYHSAYRNYGLAAPFTERFVGMATAGEDAGYIGLIVSNAFAQREYGCNLVEDVLPKFDLEGVVDLSGANVSGHGTPTLVMFLRQQPPLKNTVRVLSNLKGERTTPSSSSKGLVWRSVLRGYAYGDGYRDEYVDVYDAPREALSRHPWQFKGPSSLLYERIMARSTLLKDFAEDFGYSLQTNADQVFRVPANFARRLSIPQERIRQFLLGEPTRDWAVARVDYIVFPYSDDLELMDIKDMPALEKYLGTYKQVLGNRVVFGGETYFQANKPWHSYHQFSTSKHHPDTVLSHAFIATHNHFVVSPTTILFNRSAPIVQLPTREDVLDQCRLLAGVMNSSIACFCLKQVSFNKGTGDDPIRDRYEQNSTRVKNSPMPAHSAEGIPERRRMLALAGEMLDQADQLPALRIQGIFCRENEAYDTWNSSLDGYVAPHPDLPSRFTSARELREARDKLIALRQDIRGRMIFLQEEMDWLAYQMYGLIKKAPLAEDYLSPSEYQAARLALGIRPFEVAGKGYEGDWPEGFQPPLLSDTLSSLTGARMAIIESNPDIAILEDPLYKRRWVPPDYDKEFWEAAQWWLAEKLEWALEQHGQPISLRRWARSLGQDERVNAVLEVLTGTPMFDLEGELLGVMLANAVPSRPEHYLKPAGLRKFYGPEPTPQYKRGEFSDGTAWKIRGKLNIPRERFIAYAEFDHTRRGADTPENGGPWFGWAGWNAGQRADALAFLLDQANRAGWRLHWQQCGLRAALRDMLPELSDLPAADRAEFEAIAAMCGISLESRCYCQAYREAMARGEPGVPGVTEEALGVKVLPVGEGLQRRGRKRKDKGEQMGLGLDNP